MRRHPSRPPGARVAILLVLVALATAPPEEAAAVAAAPQLVASGSTVDRVIVYSDRARVFRRAAVELRAAATQVHLGGLPAAALRDTVRVTSSGAEVLGVEVSWSREQLVRQQQAAQLLARIEGLQDRERALADERQVLESEVAFVDGLRLGRLPAAERRNFAIGIFAAAWRQILSWGEARVGRIRTRLAELAEARHALRREQHAARVEAKGFDLERVAEPSWNVVATLKGAGKQTVTLSYLVTGPRWVPSYDLRYDPRSRSVEAAYYAVVQQRTGEDWAAAQLRFSTAQPTTLLAVPELPTWTLGRTRDFTPTPTLQSEPAPARWEPDPAAVPQDPLVERLRAALGMADASPQSETTKQEPADRDSDGIQDKADEDDSLGAEPAKPMAPRRIAAGEVLSRMTRLEDRRAYAQPSAAPPAQYPGSPPPAPPSPAPMEAEDAAEAPAPVSVEAKSAGGWGYRASTPREDVPWTDVGYEPPALDPDLPAAAAEGYRYTLYAPGRHSVPANGEERRIPLVRHRLAVQPVHRVVPGRSRAAYLSAELKNTTGRPILRGHAHLFAGAMFSGKSWLNTALPGRSLTLPLGVDDGVKVARHVRQQNVVQGVVFKDDVSAYTVELEIANHHRYPIQVELEDQIPLKSGDDVEVRAFSAKPAMGKPDKQGRIRWRGKVAAGSVHKLSFTFQIVRPKDYELQQHGG